MTSRRFALLLLAVALVLGSGCGEEPAARPNIVLILADTLRADHLGYHGARRNTSPTIDEFAAQNRWFRRAVSPAPWTSPSMASLFTGLYPTAHGVVRDSVAGRVPTDSLGPDFVTLAERLRETGYSTIGVVSNGWVTRKRGYAQGFDRFVRADGRKAPGVTQLALKTLQGLGAIDGPFFLYVHYMDPHLPNDPTPDELDRFLPRRADGTRSEERFAAIAELLASYDADIWTLDRGVEALLDRLNALGLYDDAIIAFVADHGEQFYEHREYGHGRNLHAEEIHVPLILKAPGLSGIDEDVVSTIDLAPALLELAGARPFEDVQALSLLTQRAERIRRGAFSEGTMRRNLKALVDAGQRRLILAFPGRSEDAVDPSGGVSEVGLYDLARGEKREDALDDPETSEELEELLLREYARSRELRGRVERQFVPLDAEERARLEALGYGEGAP